MSIKPAFNLNAWIAEHRAVLVPPVSNRQVFPAGDFVIMVVAGPNARNDYHVDPGAEFFYQLEGSITLRTQQDGDRVDYQIGPGEVFLLPPWVPHSPQRPAGTVGLVIERARRADEEDAFEWYCEGCNRKLYSERFRLTQIDTQFPPILARFNDSIEHRTCRHCGQIAKSPTEPA